MLYRKMMWKESLVNKTEKERLSEPRPFDKEKKKMQATRNDEKNT